MRVFVSRGRDKVDPITPETDLRSTKQTCGRTFAAAPPAGQGATDRREGIMAMPMPTVATSIRDEQHNVTYACSLTDHSRARRWC